MRGKHTVGGPIFMLSAQIACVLFLGDLLFVLLARQKSTEDFRYLPIYATFACLAFLAIRNAKTTSYKECFQISLLASISFVMLHQFIGWIWFHGIVKSNSFLSVENLQLGIVLFFASAILLFIGLSFAKVITRLWGRK